MPPHVKLAGKQQFYPTESPTSGATNRPPNGSPLNWKVIAAIVGGVLVVAVFAAIIYFKSRRTQVCKTDDIELQRVQTDNEVNDSDGGETDEANPEDALLENAQVLTLNGTEETLDSPLLIVTHDDTETQRGRNYIDERKPEDAQVPFSVQETSNGPLLTGTQVESNDGGEADEPNPLSAQLEDTQDSTGVEETLDSPLPTGTEETQEPGPHGGTGKPWKCLLMYTIFDTSGLFFHSV